METVMRFAIFVLVLALTPVAIGVFAQPAHAIGCGIDPNGED
jgi:hypothetical protein